MNKSNQYKNQSYPVHEMAWKKESQATQVLPQKATCSRVAMICLSSPGIQWPSYGSLLWHHKVEIHPYQPCSGLPNRAQGRYWPFSIANKGHTKKLLKSKNPWNFVTETFKIGIIKWHLFFDLSNFYLGSMSAVLFCCHKVCHKVLTLSQSLPHFDMSWLCDFVKTLWHTLGQQKYRS